MQDNLKLENAVFDFAYLYIRYFESTKHSCNRFKSGEQFEIEVACLSKCYLFKAGF